MRPVAEVALPIRVRRADARIDPGLYDGSIFYRVVVIGEDGVCSAPSGRCATLVAHGPPPLPVVRHRARPAAGRRRRLQPRRDYPVFRRRQYAPA
jgi:hypothetical protein